MTEQKKQEEVKEEEKTTTAKKKTTQRKPKTTPKKTQTKSEPKIEEVKEPDVEEVEKVEEQEEKVEKEAPAPQKAPRRRTVARIDMNEMIPVYSAVEGKLIYVSKKTGLEVVWGELGDEQFLEYGELMNMKASQPKFFSQPFVYIKDEDVVEKLGLKDTYDKMIHPEDMDEFFNKSLSEMKLALENAPQGTKKSIANSAGRRVSAGTLFDIRKVKMLQKELKIDLEILM